MPNWKLSLILSFLCTMLGSTLFFYLWNYGVYSLIGVIIIGIGLYALIKGINTVNEGLSRPGRPTEPVPIEELEPGRYTCITQRKELRGSDYVYYGIVYLNPSERPEKLIPVKEYHPIPGIFKVDARKNVTIFVLDNPDYISYGQWLADQKSETK